MNITGSIVVALDLHKDQDHPLVGAMLDALLYAVGEEMAHPNLCTVVDSVSISGSSIAVYVTYSERDTDED